MKNLNKVQRIIKRIYPLEDGSTRYEYTTDDINRICKNCVHYATHAGITLPKCNLKSVEMHPTEYRFIDTLPLDTCEWFSMPVDSKDLEVGDEVEVWFSRAKLIGVINYISHNSEHMSVYAGKQIPCAAGKSHVIRITKKQVISKAIFKKYFGDR